MIINELKEKIKEYLASAKCVTPLDQLNVCAYVYEIIEAQQENECELFEFFLSTADKMLGNGVEVVKEVYNDENRKQLEDKLGKAVDGILETVLAENHEAPEFYSILWESIYKSPIFKEKESKVFALFYIWIDARIPYYKMEEGMHMDNEEFANRTDKLRESIEKARYILFTKFYSQRTARASALLKLVYSENDEKNRVLLMAHILSLAAHAAESTQLRRLLDQVMPGQENN